MATKPPINILRKWMLEATAAEKVRLATKAKTTVGSLRQAAGAYRTGRLNVTPTMARNIEKAAASLPNKTLPTLKREDLCIECSKCDLIKK